MSHNLDREEWVKVSLTEALKQSELVRHDVHVTTDLLPISLLTENGGFERAVVYCRILLLICFGSAIAGVGIAMVAVVDFGILV